MPTACTSSEEKNTPNLRKFRHNIKNNDEGRTLSEDTADQYVCSCENTLPRSRLRQFFPTYPPPELVFQSIEETLLQPVLKSFITVFIQCNVGLENKLTRAPLLGLAKSMYYGPAHKFLFYLWQSRIDFQLIIKYIVVHVRHFCEGVRIVVLTAHV